MATRPMTRNEQGAWDVAHHLLESVLTLSQSQQQVSYSHKGKHVEADPRFAKLEIAIQDAMSEIPEEEEPAIIP